MAQIWDPLRKKMVALTPEERVRQWFIAVLHEEAGVPFPMMASEVSLSFGHMLEKKPYRADIVVWDRTLHPAIVVECKRPDIPLTQAVADQAFRYNQVLESPYIIITNGKSTYIAHRRAGQTEFLSALLKYEDICQP